MSGASGKARPAQDQSNVCTKESEKLCQGRSGDRSHHGCDLYSEGDEAVGRILGGAVT